MGRTYQSIVETIGNTPGAERVAEIAVRRARWSGDADLLEY
jgi:hypothetical protein